MLTAYLDESGQEQEDWAFVAGFVGDDVAWRKLPPLWAEAIGPQRQHLHMAKLRFVKLSEMHMLRRAATVPAKCGLSPIVGAARFLDYADIIQNDEDASKYAAYVMCCKIVAVAAMKFMPPNERLEIVLERQDRYGWYAAAAFQDIIENAKEPQLLMDDGETSKLASWRFVEKSDTCLCEPADYLAYALTQLSRNSRSLKSRWTSPIIEATRQFGSSGALNRDVAKNVIVADKVKHVRSTLKQLRETILNAEAEHRESQKLNP